MRTPARIEIIQIKNENHVSAARKRVRAIAEDMGFKQVVVFYIMTSVSELAYNLFFHTNQGGTITLVPHMQNNKVGIEIVAEDHGPGIENVDLAMQDGFSTNRGLGGGLPGVQRLMDEFETRSTVGVGTRIISKKWKT